MQDELRIEREKINEADRKIADAFAQRMSCVKAIARIKKENGLDVYDEKRETEVLKRAASLVEPSLVGHYKKLLSCLMSVSKTYQGDITGDGDTVCVVTQEGAYSIKIKRSGINEVKDFFNLDRKAMIVTDSAVPREYVETVASQCAEPTVLVLPQGEESKSIEAFCKIEKAMLEGGFDRHDCVVAVGGGVVGDIAGFASSAYMRGVDFYNVPTTLLSQVDSSVGGKTAINFGGVKNSVGAFKQPSGVMIDPQLLSTLDKRQISNGLAECIKEALAFDSELLDIIESDISIGNAEKIIHRCLLIKKAVVENDEREAGLRRVLNLGHTIGHAIEIESGMLHGECVALGILPMVSDEIRQRLIPLYERLGLPTSYETNGSLVKLMSHDKKLSSGMVNEVIVNEIGSFEMCQMSLEQIAERAEEVLSK